MTIQGLGATLFKNMNKLHHHWNVGLINVNSPVHLNKKTIIQMKKSALLKWKVN